MANAASKKSLKNIVMKHKPQIVGISEPKTSLSNVLCLCQGLHMDRYAGNMGDDSKIWVFWKSHDLVQVAASTSQFISLSCNAGTSTMYYLTFVYADCNPVIRPRGVPRPPLHNIWHSAYNPRAALFGWRVLHRAIPTDDQVSAFGIHLASKFSCCTTPAAEDIDHLFLSGEIASSLWRWARPLIRSSAVGPRISITLWNTLSVSNRQSAFDFISIYTVLLILWEIWKDRCAKRHDSKVKSLNGILSDIKYAINTAVQGISFKRNCSQLQLRTLLHYGFTPKFKMKRPKLVRWNPPHLGFYLNMDGASKGNPGLCGGGGCIRDSKGDIRLGFAFSYGQGDSLTTEARALCDGLRLANHHGIHISTVFSDSLVLVQSLRTNRCPSWKCTWWWREASSLLRKSSAQLHHAYRETNRVADALAVYACNTHGSSVFHNPSSLPFVCKGLAALDKAGLPSVRLL
ncbi:hypothetical protein Taro_021522 [Colocasia esculenta]|uniref:RNase H type-1 domain-containing protein n=1 Tax=Colocasia esculenta TaxID=4460 RepID=A0A843V575_COLES|nr:hypothetical protein [Colocasia esculenta]